jgi:hypothetical protein
VDGVASCYNFINKDQCDTITGNFVDLSYNLTCFWRRNNDGKGGEVCLMGGFSCHKVDFVEHCSDFSDCDWLDERYIDIRYSGYTMSSNCEKNESCAWDEVNEECGFKNCDMVVMSSNFSSGGDDSKKKL